MKKNNLVIKKIEKIAYKNEQQYGGCAQSVIGAFKEILGLKISNDVFKAATGLAGGIGLTGNSCGALTAGVMVLSTFIGREYDNFSDPKRIRFKTYELVRELITCFKGEYGSVNCYDIHRKIMGKAYNLWNKKQYKEFLDAGGHDNKCPSVCGNAAKWTIGILLKEGLLTR